MNKIGLIMKRFLKPLIMATLCITFFCLPVYAESDEYKLGSKIGAIASICHQLSDLKDRYCPMFQTSAPNSCLYASTNFLTDKYKNQVRTGFGSHEISSKYSRDARYVDDINYQTALKEAKRDTQKACMLVWNKLLDDREAAISEARRLSLRLPN